MSAFSPRKPLEPVPAAERKDGTRKDVPGSTAFVPSAAGLILAAEVVKDLIRFDRHESRQGMQK